MQRFIVLLFTLALLSGCQNQDQLPAQKSNQSNTYTGIVPGSPQYWDMEDFLSRYPLPEDTDDFYAQFRETPGYSFGVVRAHKRLSQRSHNEHDLLIQIQNGKVHLNVADREYDAVEGDVVYIPRTVKYAIESVDGNPIDIFAVYNPRFFGEDIIYYEPHDGEK